LDGVIRELSAWRWEAADLAELATPRFGLISGFPALLEELDALRALDLGETPPCGRLRRPRR
jgi:hypothetical protein